MTRIVLVRHGQAQAFIDQTVAGHACTGLSDHGRLQAASLRDRLVRTGELRGATAFYASLMRRAHETAEIIAPGVGHGSLEIRQDCGLCEQHPGEADGILWTEYDERYGTIDTMFVRDRTKTAAPGSESLDMMVERVRAALERLAREHPQETIVVACHGGVIGCSFEALAGVTLGSLVRYTENTAITEWFHSDLGWELVRYNDLAHLL
ncbi:MAG TPA: histidine phosphatase family protein [Acidimicrobiales bacterium]|jgi:probable phosphoglycerate mutase|nr:histidine phosphatase family protein [Acidimicrobiales bacterium]